MRYALLALALASSTSTLAQQAPTRSRDCLSNREFGIPAPTSDRPDAKWLYITVVMRAAEDGKRYGSVSGWTVAGSLTQACAIALSNALRQPENSGWTVTGATAQLVPDSIMEQGSAH